MAYEVNKSNGDPITVVDNTINTETSVQLVGKNFAGYGEYIAENFVHIMEHFANATPPLNPTAGQIWYNTDSDVFKYWDGTQWSSIRLDTVGPMTITDTLDVDHVVTAFNDEGNLIAVVSSETFDVNPTDLVYSQITNVGAGITLVSGTKLHGTATTAEYADLAEMYAADAAYEPGTVVKIGGPAEVTHTSRKECNEVFGVVSTAPAHLMNSKATGTVVPVALEGRVPCKVTGPVVKGQRLVASDIPGVAEASNTNSDWRCQVGRALESSRDPGVKLVEVVVGAK